MRAFYNEIDRYCCDWLQNLMDAGHITPGKIDDRSIADLSPDDVRGYERCHFFAGIAGWELALSLSGYTGPVWTGSCPCQPFSAAGKGKASGDERHLWPVWFDLIRTVRPPIIFGEQVEAAIGWGWLDLVYSDLEPEGYTVGAAVLPACSVGAPHIRQRLWFVGHDKRIRSHAAISTSRTCKRVPGPTFSADAESNGKLADPDMQRGPEKLREAHRRQAANGPFRDCADGELADASLPRLEGYWRPNEHRAWPAPGNGRSSSRPHPWDNLIWLPCTDGKQRPTQPGIFPLAHGVSARVGKLRAAGNAIVPALAAEFIRASMT